MKDWRVLSLLVCFVGVGCQQVADPSSTLSPTGSDVALDTAQQRGSYAQGWGVGRQGSSMPLDNEAFIAGMRDALSGAESRLTDAEMQQAMVDFNAFVTEARTGSAAENRAAGAAFLEQNAQREGVCVTDSGLQYEVVFEGDGARPKETDVVKVLYRGTRIDGEVFDETDPARPAQFSVNQVIAGWTEGLQLMSLGAKYKLYIPADLAYGDSPRPGVIQPGDTLVFDVEIVELLQR